MDGCEGDQVQCGETQGGKEEDLKDHKEHKEEDRVEKAGVGKGTGWHWWRSGGGDDVGERVCAALRRQSQKDPVESCEDPRDEGNI